MHQNRNADIDNSLPVLGRFHVLSNLIVENGGKCSCGRAKARHRAREHKQEACFTFIRSTGYFVVICCSCAFAFVHLQMCLVIRRFRLLIVAAKSIFEIRSCSRFTSVQVFKVKRAGRFQLARLHHAEAEDARYHSVTPLYTKISSANELWLDHFLQPVCLDASARTASQRRLWR